MQEGAVKMLTEKKKNEFIEEHITALVDEAKKLGLTKADVLSIIEKQFDK